MTMTSIPNAADGGKTLTNALQQNYWARRRAWWRIESRKRGTDWAGFEQFLDQLLEIEERMGVAR
jgi:hypothetical protein